MRKERLSETVTGRPPRHGATRDETFRLARRTFRAGNRVELGNLATTAGVSRVTIHRWFTNRANLLAEIVWSLAEPTLHQCYQRSEGTGGHRIAGVLAEFVRHSLNDPGMRAFLDRENETALRVLTRSDHSFQPRLTAAIRQLLHTEQQTGHLTSPIPLDDLAYLCVRIGESFVYTDTITGNPPDADRADRALHYLLRYR